MGGVLDRSGAYLSKHSQIPAAESHEPRPEHSVDSLVPRVISVVTERKYVPTCGMPTANASSCVPSKSPILRRRRRLVCVVARAVISSTNVIPVASAQDAAVNTFPLLSPALAYWYRTYFSPPSTRQKLVLTAPPPPAPAFDLGQMSVACDVPPTYVYTPLLAETVPVLCTCCCWMYMPE